MKQKPTKTDSAIFRAPLLNMQYSTGVNKLCVLFDAGKEKQHKRFRLLEPDNKEKADHSALINLKQNKITITEFSTKNKFELSSRIFADALKGVKDQTSKFHANQQGLVYMQLINEGVEPVPVIPVRKMRTKRTPANLLVEHPEIT